jgi:tRNA (guanine10-N2)-dimethyltransferase
MIPGFVELSQESLALAEAEAVCAAEALGGGGIPAAPPVPGLAAVEVPDVGTWTQLAGRLALARRCLVFVTTSADADVVSAARSEGTRGGSAAFRRISRPSGGGADQSVLGCGRAFKAGGGTIDLDHPSRRFWLVGGAEGREHLLEEVASVDRSAPTQRKMPLLPFRRPVSLPPKLARAAANLAHVRPSDRVLDPFLGTGALLAEAGLLGGRLYGVDRDPAMVRGALQNLAYLGVAAEELVAGDARDVDFTDEARTFSAIVTDPPYGRSSSTGGESSSELVAGVIERWSKRLTPDGRIVLINPTGGPPLRMLGSPRFRIPVRVHRSLTREFCLYESPSLIRS